MDSSNVKYWSVNFCNGGRQGLFNKLMFLSGMIRYLNRNENKNIKLVDPIYITGKYHSTLGKPTLFSEIFNIDIFNKKMKQKINFELIKRSDISNDDITDVDYGYAHRAFQIEHDEYFNICRKNHNISYKNNIMLDILDSLCLSKKLQRVFINYCITNILSYKKNINPNILKQINTDIYYINQLIYKQYNSIHMRIESDWPDSWSKLDLNDIIKILENNNINLNQKQLFFSTAYDFDNIKEKLKTINIESIFYFNEDLSYDEKTAISYQLCLYSDIYINHSLSTFSSFINMQRDMLFKNKKNYYYNTGKLLPRLDKGLYYKNTDSFNDINIPSINIEVVQ